MRRSARLHSHPRAHPSVVKGTSSCLHRFLSLLLPTQLETLPGNFSDSKFQSLFLVVRVMCIQQASWEPQWEGHSFVMVKSFSSFGNKQLLRPIWWKQARKVQAATWCWDLPPQTHTPDKFIEHFYCKYLNWPVNGATGSEADAQILTLYDLCVAAVNFGLMEVLACSTTVVSSPTGGPDCGVTTCRKHPVCQVCWWTSSTYMFLDDGCSSVLSLKGGELN